MSEPVKYLLDTNVLSETRKKKRDAGLMAFLETAEASALYVSVMTLGELRKGVAKKHREDPEAARKLAAWVKELELGFGSRILDVDAATAGLWGDWSGERPRPVVDTLLAATAVLHGLTFVTRNTRDVRGIQVKVLNPWVE